MNVLVFRWVEVYLGSALAGSSKPHNPALALALK